MSFVTEELSPVCDYVQEFAFQHSWLVTIQDEVFQSHFFGMIIRRRNGNK